MCHPSRSSSGSSVVRSGPASSSKTEPAADSESLPATTQPAAPPPTTTTSNRTDREEPAVPTAYLTTSVPSKRSVHPLRGYSDPPQLARDVFNPKLAPYCLRKVAQDGDDASECEQKHSRCR